VNYADAVALLRHLVTIPSVNPAASPTKSDTVGEGRLARFIFQYLSDAGLHCLMQEVLPGRPNVIAVLEGDSTPAVLLEAHTDTVGTDNMEIAPFEPGEEPDIVRGRGSCDDKASLAAMMTAMVRAARHTPRCSCIFAATVDEEHLFRGVHKLTTEPLPLPVQGAVVGEPTQLRIICAHKGTVRLRITVLGKAAHSAEPQRGDNAIYHAAALVEVLARHAQQLAQRPAHPLVGRPTLTVSTIQGGTAINMVPDRCEIKVDRRILPGEEPAAVAAELRQLVARHANGRFSYEVEDILLDPPMELSPDAPIVERCQRALEAAGGCSQVCGAAFGTNASKFAIAGIPALVLGPGDIAQAHTATEFVRAAEVEQAADIYFRIITNQ